MQQAESLTLAPAIGSGIGRLIAERLLADPEFLDAMTAAALGGLRAVVERYDMTAKCFVSSPDYKTRTATFFGLLAQMEGDPVKRIIHQHLGAAGVDPLEALKESPALQEAARRMLDKAAHRSNPGERAKAAAAERRALAAAVPVMEV